MWQQAEALIKQQAHRPAYVRYTIQRQARAEDGFIADVTIHAVDWLQSVLGPLTVAQRTPLPRLFGEGMVVELQAQESVVVWNVCQQSEPGPNQLSAYGDRWTLQAEWGQSLTYKQHRRPPVTAEPGARGESTWRETLAFVDAVAGQAPWVASPEEVMQAMVISQEQLPQTCS